MATTSPEEVAHKEWSLAIGGDDFVCSTNPKLIQPRAVNAALGSDMLWWAKTLDEPNLQTMLDNSLCLGLYRTKAEPRGEEQAREMVGMARLITDRVTFAYLTDVYVLSEHQGKGLGRWLMTCLNEVVDEWPFLRGMWILAGSPAAARLYESSLGARRVGVYHSKPEDMALLERNGPGNMKKLAD